MGDITDLEGHLERSSTFVSTYLHPDFSWPWGIMPSCHVSLFFLEIYRCWLIFTKGHYCLYFVTSHFAPGTGTPSHQDLAHSTEQLGALPPHLASMEKRKGEPPKPGLYPPLLVPPSSSSSHFQSSLPNLLATYLFAVCIYYYAMVN